MSYSNENNGHNGNNNNPPSAAADFRVNLCMLPQPLGTPGARFPSTEYYNTRAWQSPDDFRHFRDTRLRPLFDPRLWVAILQVQPRSQVSYVHSVVSAAIARLPAHLRDMYGVLPRGDALINPYRARDVYRMGTRLWSDNIFSWMPGLLPGDQGLTRWLNLVYLMAGVLELGAIGFAFRVFTRADFFADMVPVLENLTPGGWIVYIVCLLLTYTGPGGRMPNFNPATRPILDNSRRPKL